VVPNSLSWLRCEIFERKPMADHDLFFARVTKTSPGRLGDPPLLYSARHGWRVTGGKAREPGMSIRDRLLERLAASGVEVEAGREDEEG
jgi:flavin reductase (DIM6/NTAB) family NADH-FMN oxidoreductase RutF